MKLKEIWSDFKKTTKAAVKSCRKQIKVMCKSTFAVFKIALIDFVKAISKWIRDVIVGVAIIVRDGMKIIFAALWAAIKSTSYVLGEKVINWIKKL